MSILKPVALILPGILLILNRKWFNMIFRVRRNLVHPVNGLALCDIWFDRPHDFLPAFNLN